MVRAAFILVLGLLAAPFFSSVSLACDGIQETCPATQKTEPRWRYSSHSIGSKSMPASGYVYDTHDAAISASCSSLGSLYQSLNYSDSCSSGNYQVTTCPHTLTGVGTGNVSFKFDWKFVQSNCNGGSSTQNYTSSSGVSSQVTTFYVCEHPLYPVGPDSNNLCRMSQCPKVGQAYQPAVWNPLGPQKLCLNMPDGSKCGFNFGGISGSTPLYTSTGEGCDCSAQMQEMGACGTYQNQPPTDDNGCMLLSDGVRACPADPAERCSVAGTANGQPVTVCDQGCGYFGAGDSADQFMCLEEDPPQACTEGDTRPQCQNQNPGDCPQGAETCDKPNFPPCVEGDTRPECAGLNPGDCPPGKDCSTGGVDDDSTLQGVNRRLDQGNENTKGMLDILRKWDNAKPTEEQTNAPVTAGNSVYDEKLQEAEAEFSTVGEGDKDAALADISSNQGGFVAAVSAMLPQPTGCAPMTIAIPGYNYSWDWCHLLDMFRLFAEWVLMFVVAAYIFNDIREQGKRTV